MGPLPDLPPCHEVEPYDLVQLPEEPGLYKRTAPETSWGVPALVEAIEAATFQVALQHPGTDPVYVGDLSLEHGGPLPPHRFHSDGRSVDVGMYSLDGEQPLRGIFMLVRPEILDVARTWTLMSAFLDTGFVEHILLDGALIDTIRSWLLRHGIEPEVVERVLPPRDSAPLWTLRGVVFPAPNHADHFHVRFRCR